jgi:nucleoid-associated protein YgaU
MPPPDGGFFDEPVAADREAFGGASAAAASAAPAPPYTAVDEDDLAHGSAEEEDAGFNAAPASREWERVRPRRDYPRLGRSRRTSPVLIALVLLAVAAVAVFFLPSVLRGLLGGGTAASPTATASGSGSVAPTGSATAVPSPTATPGPTQLIYVVKSGDTLTRIADQFDVTVEQILAANPEITNPNNISVGQRIVIPTATPAPGASVSESPPP